MVKLIADCGLPLKITTQWTEDEYTDQDSEGMISTSAVKGWRVRINGQVYPRGQYDGESIDWSYRYAPREGRTEQGRMVAIKNALLDAGLQVPGFETQWIRSMA